MEKIVVLGLGYIGLPTALIAAESGFEVIGVDIDEQRVNQINKGELIFSEPQLLEVMHRVLKTNTLHATTTIEAGDYFIVAVPTPLTHEKKADLQYVYNAVDAIISVLQRGNTIILESTIPVGTTYAISCFIEQKTGLKAGEDFFIAHCPERVLPGKIFWELIANDRIIGGLNQKSLEKAHYFYKYFVTGSLYMTNIHTAELVKLVENSYRDVQLAFTHEIARIANEINVDPYEVVDLANKHPRVSLLKPTCGVGGHCIAVDPWFLAETFPEQTTLIQAARMVNDARPTQVATLIGHAIDTIKKEVPLCTVLILGITYKPDVDDVRESPALKVVEAVANQQDVHILVHDPYITQKKMTDIIPENSCYVTLEEGLRQAHIVIFLVAHQQFKKINLNLLDQKKILDFCGLLHNSNERKEECNYFRPACGVSDSVEYR